MTLWPKCIIGGSYERYICYKEWDDEGTNVSSSFNKWIQFWTLVQNLVIFAFLDWKSEFVRRMQSPIRINIRYLMTSTKKYNHKDCNQLQNLVIFNFMFITGFWYWVQENYKEIKILQKREVRFLKPICLLDHDSLL